MHHEKSPMASPQMSLKLLVDKKGARVLFAEVPKEFVDFLFQIFSLPLGTVVQLLGSNQMAGCLGKLEDSIKTLPKSYLQPGIKMEDIFINPKPTSGSNTFLLSNNASTEDPSSASRLAAYSCGNSSSRGGYSSYSISAQTCRSCVTLHPNSKCPVCGDAMKIPMTIVVPHEVIETEKAKMKNEGGFVKEVVTYMVMDDLEVKPMSTISCITLINKLGVTDLSQLEEKTISFGKDEGLKLLNASLKTNEVLTSIFLH